MISDFRHLKLADMAEKADGIHLGPSPLKRPCILKEETDTPSDVTVS